MSNYSIPSVNDILSSPRLKALANRVNPAAVFHAAKNVLDELTLEAKNAASERRFPDIAELSERIASRLKNVPTAKSVAEINASGILFPESAPCSLPLKVIDRMIQSLGGVPEKTNPQNSNGDSENSAKHKSAEEILCELLGAEDAVIVNNHAAALMLLASAFASYDNILTSHTDIYETLGGYRVEDIFKRNFLLNYAGSIARVTADDYIQKGNENPAFLYSSNGSDALFYEPPNKPTISQLAEIAEQLQSFLVFDAEWGAFHSVKEYGLNNIPAYRDLIQQGVSILIMSCGGLNACDFSAAANDNINDHWRRRSLAVIAGEKKRLNELRKSALFSAFIPAAHEIAALEQMLHFFESRETAENEIPLWQLLSTEQDNLRLRADRMATQIAAMPGVTDSRAVPCHAFLTPLRPAYTLPSWQVLVTLESPNAPEILASLASEPPGIAAPIVPDQLHQIAFNLRTVFAKYDMIIVEALGKCLN